MIEEILSHHILDRIVSFNIFGFNASITLYTFYVLGISVALVIVLLLMTLRTKGRARTAIEAFVIFVRDDIVSPNLGNEGRRFVPFFCSMLIFLLFANYFGLVPGARTITANISITLGMAFVSGMMIIGLSVKENGLIGFFKTFVPSGVPKILAPLLFLLEVASLFIRVFVLAVRLFANMAAGHMVLLGLFAFIFIMGAKNILSGYGVVVPVLVMTLFVTILELLVAAIQAYVFTLLTAIFAGLQMHAH